MRFYGTLLLIQGMNCTHPRMSRFLGRLPRRWLNSSTNIKDCQSCICSPLPRRTQEKNRLMCSIDPMLPMAPWLREYTGLTYRSLKFMTSSGNILSLVAIKSPHRLKLWTGGVSGLFSAFKALSKTSLINAQEEWNLKPYPLVNGGFTGRGSLSKGLLWIYSTHVP